MRLPLALVLLLIIVTGCGARRAPSVRIDPALATLVPADTVLLAGVRFDALRPTPLYRKVGPDTLGPLVGGIDLKDVWEALAVSNGRDVAVLARGKFSPMGLEPEPAQRGAARSSYKGYTLAGSEEATLAYLNPTTALAGRAAAVRRLIDQRGSASGPPAALAAEIAAIAPETQVWIAGLGEASQAVPHRGNLGNIATALRLVERFHAAADFRAGAQVAATALCRNPQDAASLAAALQAFLAFARLTDPQSQQAAAALHIAAEERTVRIAGVLPEPVVEALIAR
ncbi:MAG TPA: hypothetical protein VHA11_09940 [Bryobacteraceae bacterium]|nr:hypothetical protein [Bryobacteraceae bacterium]